MIFTNSYHTLAEHALQRLFTTSRLLYWLLLVAIVSSTATAQYSPAVFDLKKAQDQYDERGMDRGSAINVDGHLQISTSNGIVSYSYPISSSVQGGYTIDVSLNYAGSVAHTTFTKYSLSDREKGEPYAGWEKFHINRPEWIVGVNGFAINVLSTASHFKADPDGRIFNPLFNNFDDTDFPFVVDGYDWSNRMTDFDPVAADDEVGYTDVIRILRSDGSTLELYNTHKHLEGDPLPDTRPELYTGYYHTNSANDPTFAIVEFDYSVLPDPARLYIDTQAAVGSKYPLIPRIVRYYNPSEGLEYLFRERVAAYGLPAYKDIEARSGGVWGHPTIFYLDEIRSNNGSVARFNRARHYPTISNPLFYNDHDVTRGRALITSWEGHQLSFGYNAMMIEAMGRTTIVKFDTIVRNGNAASWEYLPWANWGGMTPAASQLAAYSDTASVLYKSFTGYVTKIIDPEGRVTSFDYEPVTRTYQDFGFPHANPGVGHQTITLRNMRLKRVIEPTAQYTIRYKPGNGFPIERTTNDQPTLNDVVDSVKKLDRSGYLLTSDAYDYGLDTPPAGATPGSKITTVTTKDHVSGLSKSTAYTFGYLTLSAMARFLPPGRFTYLGRVEETADDGYGGYYTASTVTSYAQGTAIPGTGPRSEYMIYPVSQQVTEGGIVKGYQKFIYATDTVNRFGGSSSPGNGSPGSDSLAGKYGLGVARKVTQVCRPDQITTVLLRDTTEYLHLPLVDSTLTWREYRWNKLASIANYLALRDSDDIRIRGKVWDHLMFLPPVAVFDTATFNELVHMPPVYGLVRSSWTSDSAGCIAGVKNTYLQDQQPNHGRKVRDLLLADTILGRNKRPLAAHSYAYADGMTSNSLASTTDAYGVKEEYTYNYFWATNDSIQFVIGSEAKPTGAILSNDDSVRGYALQAGSGGVQYRKPVGVRSVVRKYDEAGNLYRDTIETYTERGFYGIATGVRDANGNYTRTEVDRNGRLVTLWQPGDFARKEEFDTVSYSGTERIDLFGATWYNRRLDQLHCYKDADGKVRSDKIAGPETTTFMRDTFYAALPVTTVPVCPCKDDAETKEKVSRQIQATCDQLFPYNEHGGYKGFYGELSYPIESDSPIKTATRIDSLFLEFAIASIDGECVHLTIAIDSLYSKTYVFNCSGLPYTNATRRKDGKEGATPLGDDFDQLGSGWMVRLDLTAIAPQLRARPAGSTLTARFSTSTAGGSITFVNGSSAEDLRPRYRVVGAYQKISDRADYTLAYDHDDAALKSTATAKIDDRRHTANLYNDSIVHGATVRRASSKHYFGADYRLLKSEETVVEDAPIAPRVDTTFQSYTGLGLRRSVRDAEQDTARANHDALGRAIETINHDGTRTTTRFRYGSPASFGLTGQDFYGFCQAVTSANENGVKFTTYADAFGRVRRDVADSSGLRLTTRYDYDLAGRLTEVVSPKGDTTRYWYDDFGRVKYKRHPDLGIVSYAYDKLGRVRFAQDAVQADEQRLTFTQYDDLGRVTLVGDAYFDSLDAGPVCPDYDEDAFSRNCTADTFDLAHRDDAPSRKTKHAGRMVMSGGGDPAPNRLTNRINPDSLHTWPAPSLPTANPTIWLTPVRPIAGISPVLKVVQNCGQLPAHPLLGETTAPVAPFLMHPTQFHSALVPGAAFNDFENVARHPEFVRVAVAYDSVPASSGSVWAAFPQAWRWDGLAPRGVVRNQRGREAAVAWRDRGSEPFHYAVMSYDEHGRVEALLRYTENLGFDAVYYTYNAADQVTSVTAADFLRQHTTWYGFDGAGRIDSVWTALGTPGSGLWVNNQLRAPSPQARPATADIVYRYTKSGQLATMAYPPANVLVTYAYNHRKLLDSLVAMKSGANLFREILSYDPTGQITQQIWQQGTAGRRKQMYAYDSVQRLTRWTNGPDGGTAQTDTTRYTYDAVGNRLSAKRSWIAQTENYTIAPGAPEGNQLAQRRNYDAFGGDTLHTYSYYANGARAGDLRFYESGGQSYTLGSDELGYSYRGLLRRVRTTAYLQAPYNATPTIYDWRYRYSAFGEREQKRLYDMPSNDSVARYPWVYYLLGGGGAQLAVYHGQQTIAPMCGDTGRRVYIYPVEYLSYGVGNGANVTVDPTGAKKYAVADHVNSVRSVVKEDGTVESTRDYSPFGEVITTTGNLARKSFINRESDLESGDLNTGARQYDSRTGRFLSLDPFMEAMPGESPYSYAFNNPVRRSDPDGLMPNGGPGAISAPYPGGAEVPVSFPAPTSKVIGDIIQSTTTWLESVLATASPTYATIAAPNVGFAIGVAPATATGVTTSAMSNQASSTATAGAGNVVHAEAKPSKLEKAGEKLIKKFFGEGTGKKGTSGGPRSGRKFTKSAKRNLKAENQARHDGQFRCEACDQELVDGQPSKKGVSPPSNQAEADHIYPRAHGGDGAESNGQYLCKECNLEKGDRLPPK